MKKSISLLLCFVLCLLCSCSLLSSPDPTADPSSSAASASSAESSAPAETYTFILPDGVTTEDVLTAFFEVALTAEYASDGSGTAFLRKWTEPLYYKTEGDPEEGDLGILEAFFEQLNRVDGFPGIYPADEKHPANLTLGFYDGDELNEKLGSAVLHEVSDGAMQYAYYTDSYRICEGKVGYRREMLPVRRPHVLQEEIVNVLGFGDSTARTDSILYQYGSRTREPSEMDWLLIRLLYCPQMKPGMDRTACETLLRELLAPAP